MMRVFPQISGISRILKRWPPRLPNKDLGVATRSKWPEHLQGSVLFCENTVPFF
jgi:hypothetical protein